MSTKSVCDMNYGKMHEFALVLDKAGFDADLIQKVINSKGNKIAKAMYAALVSEIPADERFKLVNTFNVVVPEGYNHATRLKTFSEEYYRDKFYYYNDAITDENFAKATIQLVPGRKFEVEVFQIKRTITSEDCLKFLRSQNAVLVGAQGASLAYEQGKDQLPSGRWLVSFDEKEALWKDSDGNHRVPHVIRYSDGDFGLFLGCFEHAWHDGFCLLCFCDFPE